MTTKRITVKDAMKCHPLAPAVLRQLGGGADAVQSAIDAAEHGADAGFNGFTYYADTLSFARRNRELISQAVKDMADDCGETPISLVQGFGCLKDSKISEEAAAVALYGGKIGSRSECLLQDVEQVDNALAWFALEEVGRAIQNLQDD
jgi:hypothetical protein